MFKVRQVDGPGWVREQFLWRSTPIRKVVIFYYKKIHKISEKHLLACAFIDENRRFFLIIP